MKPHFIQTLNFPRFSSMIRFSWIVCFFFSLCLFSASMATAEYYQWVDKKGVKHFTDDYSEVPVDQRPNLKVHKTIEASEDVKPPKAETPPPKDITTVESLIKKKEELDKEYTLILQKTEELTAKKEEIEPGPYNEQVSRLNNEIIAYEKKRKEYDRLVEKYNQQVKAPKKKTDTP